MLLHSLFMAAAGVVNDSNVVMYEHRSLFKALILWLPALIGFAVWIFVIVCVVLMTKSLLSISREQKLMRQDIAKLAERRAGE